MKRIRDYENKIENDYYTFSSRAKSPEEALATLTLETCGPYMGPEDFDGESGDAALACISAHWCEAEEMDDDAAEERIRILAANWDLDAAELDYLK